MDAADYTVAMDPPFLQAPGFYDEDLELVFCWSHWDLDGVKSGGKLWGTRNCYTDPMVYRPYRHCREVFGFIKRPFGADAPQRSRCTAENDCLQVKVLLQMLQGTF